MGVSSQTNMAEGLKRRDMEVAKQMNRATRSVPLDDPVAVARGANGSSSQSVKEGDSMRSNPSQPSRPAALTLSLGPRWTWRSAFSGIVLTACVYLLLPYLEMLTQPPERNTTIRSVKTAELPPPPPAPPKRANQQRQQTRQDTPKPKLKQARQRLAPLAASMNLSMALGDVGGDFSLDFGVTSPALTQQVQDMVFELEDLDERPRPLARMRPVYPPQARMRRLEGFVSLEFVVSPDGSVRDVEVLSSRPGDVFRQAAIQCVQRWRFSPGTKGGEPVSSRVRQKLEFRLSG